MDFKTNGSILECFPCEKSRTEIWCRNGYNAYAWSDGLINQAKVQYILVIQWNWVVEF